MHQQGMTLNLISFGGLALGIGILVDGAVVILESIYKKREEGLSPHECAVEGASEVASAVLAGTVTTVAVFVPVVFVGELAGIVFREMALVVTFSLLCALLAALTLVPMLARRLLERPARAKLRVADAIGQGISWLEEAYGRGIAAVLQAPWAVVLGSGALLWASYVLSDVVGAELMPEADEAQLEADVELPLGTRLEDTIKVVHEMERRMLAILKPEEIRHRIVSAGPKAWWRMDGSNKGAVELLLVPATERSRGVLDLVPLIQEGLADFPGAKMRVRPRSSNPLSRIIRGGDDRLSVEIRGHDLDTADRLADQVQKVMIGIDGIRSAQPDRELGQLERTILVDRQRAAELGLGSADVARAIETYLNGRIATQYRDAGDEFDLRVQLNREQSNDLRQLEELPLVTPTGEQVPLHAIARIEPRVGPSSISRIDQQRVLRVSAWPTGRPLGEIARDLERELAKVPVPEGFAMSVEGETTEQNATFRNLYVGIWLSLFLVFAVMAVQFESLKQPLIIMVSVPFALTGVVVSLLLTGTTLNMYSLLGAIVLVGIVVNNAIVLLDATNRLRSHSGLSVRDALITAGQRRLRPILMTTLTTLLGLVPLAMGMGEGGEMQSPMARAIVGGLFTSTIVTLVLVPAIYYLVERRRDRRTSV
jgi:hydrophobic/amphiphilic exporter-1 (mainly G- bacteria), HAE1 family